MRGIVGSIRVNCGGNTHGETFGVAAGEIYEAVVVLVFQLDHDVSTRVVVTRLYTIIVDDDVEQFGV